MVFPASELANLAPDEHPYAHSGRTYTVHGIGLLSEYTFSGANPYVVKYFADPERVVNCMVHTCAATWVWPLLSLLTSSDGGVIIYG